MLDYKFSIKKIIVICIKLALLALLVYAFQNLSIIAYIIGAVVISVIVDLVAQFDKKIIKMSQKTNVKRK